MYASSSHSKNKNRTVCLLSTDISFRFHSEGEKNIEKCLYPWIKKGVHNDNDSYETVENGPRPVFACSVDMLLVIYLASRWWTRVASWDIDISVGTHAKIVKEKLMIMDRQDI